MGPPERVGGWERKYRGGCSGSGGFSSKFFFKHLQVSHHILLYASMTSDDAMGSPLWFRAEVVLHVHSSLCLVRTPAELNVSMLHFSFQPSVSELTQISQREIPEQDRGCDGVMLALPHCVMH